MRGRRHDTGAGSGTTTRRTTAAGARASTLWIALLALASTGVTLLLACATPFTALAALAATQMRARDGALVMVATWLSSQAVAFLVHGYPATGNTLGWGLALGIAALAAVAAARGVADRLASGAVARIAVAYLAATVAFKAVILVGALMLAGGWSAFAPAVLAREVARNGAILIGLYLLYHGLVAIGVPAARDPRLAAA